MHTRQISYPCSIQSGTFLRAYLTTMRPYLLFVSGITVIAGLATGDAAPGIVAITAAAGFLSYGFGQALTDCFQTDTDALSSPYRPLVRGIVTTRQVAAVSLAGLTAVGVAFAIANPHNLWLAAVGALGLATYTPFKRRWATGPFYNAWIVALLCYIGISAAAGGSRLPSLDRIDILLLAAAFFGYANFVLAGYFKDISADRATGYNTFPVRFGWTAGAIGSDIFAVLSLVAVGTLLLDTPGTSSAAVAFFYVPACITSITAQLRLHRLRDERQAHRSISLVVHSYILQLSAAAAALQPEWLWPLVMYFLLYLAVLSRRPMKAQV